MKFTAIWQSKTPHELPWTEEIFGDLIAEHVFDANHEVVLDDAILLDSFIKRVPHDYYRKFEGKNAFLVHFLDETYEGGYERYDHFRGVIRNYWSTAFNRRRVFIHPAGYWNPAKPQFKTFTPASRRKYLWSFDGELRKSSRPEAVKALRRIEPHFLRDTGPTYEKATLVFKPEYQEVLSDSAFAPAPMGNVMLETPRIYEALELGSIPLIETRRAYPYFEHVLGSHPLPTFERWGDATAFVERHARDPAALDALQRSCLDWWADFKVGLSRRVRDFIASAPQDRRDPRSPPLFLILIGVAKGLPSRAEPLLSRRCVLVQTTASCSSSVSVEASRDDGTHKACEEPMAERKHVLFVRVLPPPLHGPLSCG